MAAKRQRNRTARARVLAALLALALPAAARGQGDPNAGVVRLQGTSLADNNGPFLGLGFSYMRALWDCKNDRGKLTADLGFMAQNGFNHFRMLSMVGWSGLEIAPVDFTNASGQFIPAWTDYDQQFRDLVDIAYDQYGLRTQITIFADAQTVMPNKPDRYAHMDRLLANVVAGREHKILVIEAANEAWQNGFPYPGGVTDLREFGTYLKSKTNVPISLSSAFDTAASHMELYGGSGVDMAMVHGSRDVSVDNGWGPVTWYWDWASFPGCPPTNINEPIGPGSSVAEQTDPLKLVMAAAFAYAANIPVYVFHSRAGVTGFDRNTGAVVSFQNLPGVTNTINVVRTLPPDVASWTRNDGNEAAAPFTLVSGALRNTGARQGGLFVCVPIGISGSLELDAREPLSNVSAYDPLTGQVVDQRSLNAGDRWSLPQGPGAYIITNYVPGTAPPPAPSPSPSPSPAPPPAVPGENVLIDDPLSGSTNLAIQAGPGQFVAGGGWQSTGGKLVYDAGGEITDGYFEAKMWGWTAPAQGADKTHPLAGWETQDRYGHYLEPGCFWNWRIGMGYDPFKVLAADQGINTRVEARVGSDGDVNTGAPHTYRVQWKNGTIDFLFDGNVLQSWTLPRFQVRYFTVGHDDQYDVITNPAPIFSDVKIVDRSGTMSPPPPPPPPGSATSSPGSPGTRPTSSSPGGGGATTSSSSSSSSPGGTPTPAPPPVPPQYTIGGNNLSTYQNLSGAGTGTSGGSGGGGGGGGCWTSGAGARAPGLWFLALLAALCRAAAARRRPSFSSQDAKRAPQDTRVSTRTRSRKPVP